MAQGVFGAQLNARGIEHRFIVDSAGTHAYHVGRPPDSRASAAAQRRGVDITHQRARQVEPSDFLSYDVIVSMDRDNHDMLRYSAPVEQRGKLRLFMSYAPDLGLHEVPDPYYGDDAGFEKALDLIEAACVGLIDELASRIPR
jgi:protein-tyrosine phosphatase